MVTKAAARNPRGTASLVPRADANAEPWQREHELANAVVTLLIAVSRYGGRSDADRLAVLQHIALVAYELAERVRDVRGVAGAAAFRRALGRRRQP